MTEDKPETRQSKRNGVFNLYYYLALAALWVVVIFRWVVGGEYGVFGTVAVWAVCAFILIGFLNSIGLFGRR
jgi:hypothetical protein